MLEATIKIGGGGNLGADGMAFWFVRRAAPGPTFGGLDQWEGLAVTLDTFDNDRSVST